MTFLQNKKGMVEHMEVYFDNAATTKVSLESAEAVMKMMVEDYGNPSSLHSKGYTAEKALESSRQAIATALKVQKKDVYFTSGGTEGNNMILFGVLNAYKREGKHVLVSSIEHPSVKNAAFAYEALGYEVEEIPTDQKGKIDVDDLLSMIRQDTLLVSIMHVNNEIGTIQDLPELSKAIKLKNKHTLFHVDAVQSFCKYDLKPGRIGVDMVTLSSHKIHGPKGSGAVYVNPSVRMTAMVVGGNQQKGVRPGTENVPGAVGFGVATKQAMDNMVQNADYIASIRTYMIQQLKSKIEDIEFNSDIEAGAYHILNIRVVGVKSEVLLHTLEDANIYVSTGSACSSNKKHHSSTLQALGQDSNATDQAIRLSFSRYNTLEEVDYFIEKLNESLPMLRRFVRK